MKKQFYFFLFASLILLYDDSLFSQSHMNIMALGSISNEDSRDLLRYTFEMPEKTKVLYTYSFQKLGTNEFSTSNLNNNSCFVYSRSLLPKPTLLKNYSNVKSNYYVPQVSSSGRISSNRSPYFWGAAIGAVAGVVSAKSNDSDSMETFLLGGLGAIIGGAVVGIVETFIWK
ncbi:MAG: hypothetical protein GYA51_06520 [Candidatus Methanofastidiosa archaeon]|nr:hypothetical protein [Candidatus Methanofastidiosa archaeon]